MYIRTIPFATPDYDLSVQLRERLLRRPLGKSLNIIGVRHEYKQITLGAFDPEDRLLGVLVLKPQSGSTVRLRQMAVTEQMQQKGIGRSLVQSAIDRAGTLRFKRMICHARADVIPFYEKLGFKEIGDPFEEVGIEHRKMELELK